MRKPESRIQNLESRIKLGSFRDRAREQRKEIDRDTAVFFKLSFLFIGAFFLLLFVPTVWLEKVDNINPLVAAIITTSILLLITIKLIVGKRKMW